jgi:anti-anti-sigma regulatory factor
MDISISQQQGNVPVTVFHIRGDINANTYEDLLKQAEQSVQSGARDLVLDMSEVPYMSSAGIRALNAIFRMMRGDSPAESDEAMSKGLRDGSFKSPHLKLVNPNRNVQEVLKMAGFDMFLEIHRNLKDAVASY